MWNSKYIFDTTFGNIFFLTGTNPTEFYPFGPISFAETFYPIHVCHELGSNNRMSVGSSLMRMVCEPKKCWSMWKIRVIGILCNSEAWRWTTTFIQELTVCHPSCHLSLQGPKAKWGPSWCLLPLCLRTRTLYAESSLSLFPPQWQVWRAFSGISPTARLKKEKKKKIRTL